MVRVAILGGSGYVGAELMRILTLHPEAEIIQVTSERFRGKPLKLVNPTLRGQTNLKFSSIDDLVDVDTIFSCLPHGSLNNVIDKIDHKTDSIVDLSSDFRLNSTDEYLRWYGKKHPHPELLDRFVYGIPELHRERMRSTKYISSAGCNATATILGLYPLVREGIIDERIITEVKVGSSEGGKTASSGSHHPERVRSLRSYQPTSHRHSAEVMQELNIKDFHMSATAVDIVRGVLATSHVFLNDDNLELQDKDLWNIYRKYYGDEPFVRIIKENRGNYRYPDPKTLVASNYCDVGFELDSTTGRIVVLSAIDNLMKGAAGQAVQAFNIMNGFDEITGLEFPGLFLY